MVPMIIIHRQNIGSNMNKTVNTLNGSHDIVRHIQYDVDFILVTIKLWFSCLYTKKLS